MKKSLHFSIVALSVLLNACSAKKDGGAAATNSPAQLEEAPIASGSEHCLDQQASACFVEVNEDGRSKFYTTQDYQAKWLTNDGFSKSNIKLEVVPNEKYQLLLSDGLVPRMTYADGINLNADVLEEDGQVKALPGRDANAKLPLGALGKNAGALAKFKGVFKGGAAKGAFSKLFNLKSTSRVTIGKGSIFATLGILLGIGAGGAAIGTSASNSRDLMLPANFDVKISFGGKTMAEKVEVGD